MYTVDALIFGIESSNSLSLLFSNFKYLNYKTTKRVSTLFCLSGIQWLLMPPFLYHHSRCSRVWYDATIECRMLLYIYLCQWRSTDVPHEYFVGCNRCYRDKDTFSGTVWFSLWSMLMILQINIVTHCHACKW